MCQSWRHLRAQSERLSFLAYAKFLLPQAKGSLIRPQTKRLRVKPCLVERKGLVSTFLAANSKRHSAHGADLLSWPWQGLLSQQRSPCFIFSLISPLSSLRRRAPARSILGFRQLPKQSCSLPFQASTYGNRARIGAFGTEHRGIEHNTIAHVHSDNSGIPVDKEATLTPSRIDAQPFASRRPTIVQLRRSKCISLGCTWPCVIIHVCHWRFLFQFCTQIWTHVCMCARTNTHTCVPYACHSDAK